MEWRVALQLDSQNTEALGLLADYYLAVQDWAQARIVLQQLKVNAPNTPYVWSRLARAAAHMGDDATVQTAVEQALKRDPDDVEALGLQSTLLARDENWDEQIKTLQKLVRLQPQNQTFTAHLANSLIAQNRYTEARALLNKILASDPQFAAGYSMRAEALMGDSPGDKSWRQAETDLKKALSLEPEHERARWLLGKLYLQRKQPRQAVPHFALLAKTYTDRPVFLSDLANAYQAVGEISYAIATRQKAARLAAFIERRKLLQSRLANNADDFESNLDLGLLLLRSSNPLNAEKYINKALALRPGDKKVQKADKELEKAYNKKLMAGLNALKAGNLKKADHEISRAMLLRPRDPRTIQAVTSVTQAAQKAALPSSP